MLCKGRHTRLREVVLESIGLLIRERLKDLAGDPEVMQQDRDFPGESDQGLFLSTSGGQIECPLLKGAGFS